MKLGKGRKTIELETMSIQIPAVETVPISSLKCDGDNPNRMTKQEHERLATSIKKFGFIVPIITNRDLLIADGEQRWVVAHDLGMIEVPVVRLPVEDVDRRLLRQVLNKLRGEHELLLDANEFAKIVEMGKEDDLKHLLDLNDNELQRYLTAKEWFDPVDGANQGNLGEIQKTKCPSCGFEF